MQIEFQNMNTLPVILKVVAVILVAILLGCSHGLGRPQAASLIKGDPNWPKPLTVVVKIGGIAYMFSDVSLQKKLQSSGYMVVQGPLAPGHYYTYTVQLTPKGNELIASHDWTLTPTGERTILGMPAPPPIPQNLTIPIGTLHLLEVTGIVGDDKKATADFVWQMDCNEAGIALGCTSEKKSGRRSFTRYDDGWRLDPATTQR